MNRRTTARGVALKGLVEVDDGGRANVVVPRLLSGSRLSERDRNLVTELVYGTSRMQRACDWVSGRFVRGTIDRQVRSAIRMGVYQLIWTRVPPHAAVAATVEEVDGPGRSVVNAVLRRCAELVEKGSVVWPDPATELSYPDWIVAKLAKDLGSAAARGSLETMNLPASATVRDDGYFQDPASQKVASHVADLVLRDRLDDRPVRVLDICAAPGGKATALAGAGIDLVVAADISIPRTKLIAENADRLGASSVVTTVADGTSPAWRNEAFDAVLVDAPCSGLGVLRRRPDARWRAQPGDVPRLAELQKRLLSAAQPLVRPGGILAYSVCTLTMEETAGVDRWLSASSPGFKPLPPPGEPWQHAGRGGLLLPQAQGTDGMFLVALRRT
ncbi:MAG TPA: transcription antitermination factor NusB [Acidimicrobiales bacterium]|nr:transcription antitermination factor NusB [Acidimicrobiales bacterium]